MTVNSPYQETRISFIKGILPPNLDSYKYGSGESVFFIVNDETRAAYDAREPKTDRLYYGILDNNSMYYLGLNKGERLPLEMRGEFKPVVPLDYLKEHWQLLPQEIDQDATGDDQKK